MGRIRKGLIFIILAISMIGGSMSPTYANQTNSATGVPSGIDTPHEKSTITKDDKSTKGNQLDGDDVKKIDDFLVNNFGNDIFSDMNLTAGYRIATPFVILAMTLTLALVIILMYMFFSQTALDLFYLMVTSSRGFFNAKAEKDGFGNKSEGGNSIFSISDSAYDAVNGGGSGGVGGGDKTRKACLMKYISYRTKEFIVFTLFIPFIFGGLAVRISVVIFHLFLSLFNGLLGFI